MKSKAFLTAGLTAISLLSAFPTMTAFAGSSSIPTFNASINAEKPTISLYSKCNHCCTPEQIRNRIYFGHKRNRNCYFRIRYSHFV